MKGPLATQRLFLRMGGSCQVNRSCFKSIWKNFKEVRRSRDWSSFSDRSHNENPGGASCCSGKSVAFQVHCVSGSQVPYLSNDSVELFLSPSSLLDLTSSDPWCSSSFVSETLMKDLFPRKAHLGTISSCLRPHPMEGPRGSQRKGTWYYQYSLGNTWRDRKVAASPRGTTVSSSSQTSHTEWWSCLYSHV